MTQLTVQTARDLPPGHMLRDHIVSGLQLRCRAAGVKSWHLYYVFEGRERRPKLGAFPDIGIEDARKVAKEWKVRIAQGIDPSAARIERRSAPTVADLVELYLERVVAEKRPRTQEEYRRNINLHILPHIGAERVADITVAQLSNLLKRMPGKAAANRVHANLSGMFKLALHSDYGWRTGANPMRDVAKNVERKRRRKVEVDEFVKLAKELDRLEPQYPRQVAVIRVSLLAGTRITELVGAERRWLRNGCIVLDEHKTMATGEPRVIILPIQAQHVIGALRDDGSGYIFGRGIPHPRPRKKPSPHLTRHNVGDVWQLVRQAAGFPDIRVQDMRRTFGSVAGSVGVGLDGVGQLFGHRDPKTTRGYQWLYDDAARANAQATANKIGELMSPGGRPDDYWSG